MTTKKIQRVVTVIIEVVVALAIVGAIVAYSLSGIRLGISRNWGAFLGETLIVFVNLFIFLRKHASPVRAWWASIVALLVHCTAGAVACLYIEDIPLVWFAVAAIVEIVLLLRIVEQVSLATGSHTSSPSSGVR
jgi:hypothetical protein